MAYENDILTRNDNDELSVRVVQSVGDNPASSYDDVYTRDDNGKLAVRVVGAGGGDQHNLGYFATQSALETAYPTAEEGDYALVGDTDTFWVWDEDTSAWVDTGNKEGSTFLTYPNTWTTTGTTKAFCDDIAADDTATVGKAYLGEVTLTDLPGGIVNSEIEVKIMNGTTALNKVIVLELTSGNVAPYRWQYTYWDGGNNVSGWVGFQEELPSQTGNSGKFLATENGSLLWKDVPTPQVQTMPLATSANAGRIVQFVGNQPTVPASATISQTTGSGLTDLAVDVATFESAEQPSGDESVNFVAASVNETIDPTQFVFDTATIEIDPTTFLSMKTSIYGGDWANVVRVYFSYDGDNDSFGAIAYDADNNDLGSAGGFNPTMWGISVVSGTLPSSGSWGTNLYYTPAGIQWSKGGDTVTLSDYGISFTGTANDGDVLTVVYIAEIPGYDTGYFYVNTPTHTDSSATISQTTGSGLTDLAVDAATFATQESDSGSYVFTANTVPQTLSPTVFNNIGGATFTFDADTFVAKAASTLDDGNLNLQLVRLFKVTTRDSIQMEVGAYDAGGNVINSRYFTVYDLEAEWGLTIDGTFVFDNTQEMDMNYTPSGIAWTLNSETVDLTDYGISYTGTPVADDALTVVFTAASISGYAWEQIDVQPSSGGGQNIEYENIDYVYGVDPSDVALYFELENLPTGDYYFYLKSLKNVNTEGGDAYAYQTNKVSFHWDSSWNGQDVWPLVRALSVSPVLDGEFVGSTDQQSAFLTNSQPPFQVWYSSGDTANKFAIKLANWTLAQIYNIYHDESAIYKISKLYGGETPVSLGAQKIGRYDSITGYDYSANGGNTTPIVPPQTLPTKINQTSYSVWTCAQTNQIILLGGIYFRPTNANITEAHISLSCLYGDFVAKIIFNTNGNAEQQIIKASGPFATSRVRISPSNGETYINLDNAAFAALQNQDDIVYMAAGIYGTLGTTEPYLGVYESTQFPNYSNAVVLPLANGEASYVMDTPTIHEYKSVIQYVGETDANYTKGYFYEADGTVVTVPASLTCTETTSTGTTITCTGSDVDGLVNKLRTLTGWSAADVKNNLNNNYQWYANGDSVNPEINWAVYGTWYGQDAADILGYFTFSPTLSTPINWTTSNYQDGHDELQNAVWVQKDVQPSGGLQNLATGSDSLSILGNGTTVNNCVEIGVDANARDAQATVVGRYAEGGYDATATGYYARGANYSSVYGYNATANYQYGLAYGAQAVSDAVGAIQIGKGTNADAGTLKVGQTTDGTNWTNIELLTAAGLIPVERLASITGLADGNYKLRLTISSGVPTLSWVAE